MKRYAILMIAVLALVPAISYAQSTSDISIALVDQNPSPAEPGANVDIEISIQNSGQRESSAVALEIMPSGPFSLVKGDRVKTFSRIGAQDSFRVTYTLLVDGSALAGDYDLGFRVYNPVTPDSYATKEVTVTVIGETKMIIGKVETVPSRLEPGGSARIQVTIRNVGTGDARQLEARMNSTAAEIVPVLSGGLVYAGDLGAGEETVLEFVFGIDPDANQDTYLSQLTLTYKDENNQQNSDVFPIGIPVVGNIRFEVVNVEPSFTRGTLDIEIANKGTGDASSVEATLVVNGEAVGVDYLSSIKATKKTTLSFPLVLSGNAELQIAYVEPGLEQKTLTKELGPLNFAAPGGSGSSTLFFIIVLAVVGYFVWRRWFRKKKRKA